MTKQEQIDIVRNAAQSLSGTLTGDWLSESIDIASSALDSDIHPSVWVHGIEEAVAVKTSAKVAEIQASFQKREDELAKREAAFEKREADFEHWRADFHNTVVKTSSHLEYVIDHL
tara:strand:- start:726 stop:1073 length:348 start_codon:yes stop_codon:yes gene_type:complete